MLSLGLLDKNELYILGLYPSIWTWHQIHMPSAFFFLTRLWKIQSVLATKYTHVSSDVGDWIQHQSPILKWRPILEQDLQLAVTSCFIESASCFVGRENATGP